MKSKAKSAESAVSEDKGKPKTAIGQHKGMANLRPAKPGEVRNPLGKNQFTDGRKRVMETALSHADMAMAVLASQLTSEDEAIRQRAALAILERGAGKPVQPTANTDSEGNDIPPPPPMVVQPVATAK